MRKIDRKKITLNWINSFLFKCFNRFISSKPNHIYTLSTKLSKVKNKITVQSCTKRSIVAIDVHYDLLVFIIFSCLFLSLLKITSVIEQKTK
jgi:hypothetical protein